MLDTVESGSNEDEQMASSSSAHLNSSDINVIDLDFENDSDFLPDTSARKSKKPKFEATSCFTTRSASISSLNQSYHFVFENLLIFFISFRECLHSN